MKKIFSLLLVVFVIFGVVGCGSITKGEPDRELADSLMLAEHSQAVFVERVQSDVDGDLYTFYYEVPVNCDNAISYTKYSLEFYYNSEAKQWIYQPIEEVDKRYEWDIAGTWYPINDERNAYNAGWYSGCVMTIGEVENDQIHVRFEKSGNVCFDDYVKFNVKTGTMFSVKTSSSSWDNINMIITPHTVQCSTPVGTRASCGFERR